MKTYGEDGWSLGFVFASVDAAKKAWQDARDVALKQEENRGIGVYNFRFEESGRQHILIFGGGVISPELKTQFQDAVREGEEVDVPNEVLVQIVMTHEATREPSGLPNEVHNLRIFPIMEQ